MFLSDQLQRRIEGFWADHDLRSFYKGHEWAEDTWETGFADMRQLEIDLSMAAKHGYLTKTHIMAVAKWGRLRNIKLRLLSLEIVVAVNGG